MKLSRLEFLDRQIGGSSIITRNSKQQNNASTRDKASSIVAVKDNSEETPEEFSADRDLNIDSLRLAYDLAIGTYALAERRFDVLDKRLQDMLVFGVTGTAALITLFIKWSSVNHSSYLFYLASVYFALGVGTGTWARIAGDMRVLHATKLYNDYLTLSEAEFRRSVIFHAGNDQTTNASRLNKKSRLTGIVGLLFVLEFSFLACS